VQDCQTEKSDFHSDLYNTNVTTNLFGISDMLTASHLKPRMNYFLQLLIWPIGIHQDFYTMLSEISNKQTNKW